MLVISPHLDDAVFSCGDLLAAHPGSSVVTIFAGLPQARRRCTEWDARCGFSHAEEAVAWRRQEDRRALAELGARPYWLEFCDSQYGEPAHEHEVRARLRQLLLELAPERVVIPLGLYHRDHLLAHAASLKAVCSLPALPFVAYEDVPYRGMCGVLEQRLAALRTMGIEATPAPLTARRQAPSKQLAVRAYASQLRGFGRDGCREASRPERYWRLDARPGKALSCGTPSHGG